MVKKAISPAAPFTKHFPNIKLKKDKDYFYGRCSNINDFSNDKIIATKEMDDGGSDLYIIELNRK